MAQFEPNTLPFSELLADFLCYMANEKQFSAHTQESYQRDIDKFQHYCVQVDVKD